jgi:hypothetical protein
MKVYFMEQIFDGEIFNQTLVVLKRLANAHQEKNEAVRQMHNRAFQKGVPEEYMADIPDVASVTNSETVGGAIINLLQTIPGISTDEEMADTLNNPNSIALSDRATSVLLRRANGGEVGFYLEFATPDWPKHTLKFERTDPQHNRVEVSVVLGLDTVPIRGQVGIGTIDNGQFVHNAHEITYDSAGLVSGTYPEYGLKPGDSLNIVRLIQQVTTPENLGSPLDVPKMIALAKPEEPKMLNG